jgi:hypothetical protein
VCASGLRRGSKIRRSHVAALRHVKDPYNYRGSRSCKLNSLCHFSPIVLPFSVRGLSRHLCAERAWRGQVRPKAGWYNKRIGCSALGGETHRPYSKRRKEKTCANRNVWPGSGARSHSCSVSIATDFNWG